MANGITSNAVAAIQTDINNYRNVLQSACYFSGGGISAAIKGTVAETSIKNGFKNIEAAIDKFISDMTNELNGRIRDVQTSYKTQDSKSTFSNLKS